MDLTVIIFILVYVAMAFGTFPGIKIDRTGASVAGALAMIGFGIISPKLSWDAIDYSAIGLLFGLMVVSASFTVSGFYHQAAQKVASLNISPPKLLAVFIIVGALLASVLTNDIVVVAMTPLLVSVTLSRGLNPIPFLLGFCFAANNGAAGSLIGSPKNMVVAQGLDLSFIGILNITAIPVLFSVPIVWCVITLLYRNRWYLSEDKKSLMPNADPSVIEFNWWETIKAATVLLAVILAFLFSELPRELVALSAACFLLLNRKIASSDMLKHVDGDLILLMMGLFIINTAFSNTGIPQEVLHYLLGKGIDLNSPITLFLVTIVMSIFVGTTPTVILLIQFVYPHGNVDLLGAALILGACFAGNIFIFGSIAGIIAVEQSSVHGIKISFLEFTKSGGIISIICIFIAVVWLSIY